MVIFSNFDELIVFLKEGLIKKDLNPYIFNLILRKDKWDQIDRIISRYSKDKRNKWNLKLIKTRDPEFFVLEFNNLAEIVKVEIFIKILFEIKNYLIIRAYSFEKSELVDSSIVSLVKYSNGFWMANLDSNFLIKMEEELKHLNPNYELKYLNFVEKYGHSVISHHNPEGLDDFINRRNDIIHHKGLYSVLKRFRAVLSIKNKTLLRFWIGDDCRLYIESGYFNILSKLQNKIEDNLIQVLEAYNLEIEYTIEELVKNREKFRVFKTKSFDQIVYQSDDIDCNDWFSRLLAIFSENQYENYCFTMIEQGNPYLLVKIIDTQSGEILFCSATQNYFKITPSTKNVSGETIASFLKSIQTEIGIQV